MDDLKSIIGKVATGASLSRDEAASAFDAVMSGEATPSQMGGLLMALRVRGETVDEITGAVSAMRSKMLTVTAPPDAVDALGRSRRAGLARREDRPQARTGRPLRARMRHRLHVRAGPSSGHEERRPDPGRARDARDLQSARTAVQSGRREAADGRRILAAMGAAAGAGTEEPRLRIRLGRARLRWP